MAAVLRVSLALVVFALHAQALSSTTQTNTTTRLAQTPQMGWSTWNALKDEYNESTIHTIAERLNTLGLKDAGYNYLLLDEGWSDYNRTSDGFLQSNRSTFPSGISVLSSYVHGKGLKLGLYGDSGILTCGFRPGSLGYEERDALTLASWGVDYWKYDNCGGYAGMTRAPQERFGVMQYALERAGREIFYAVCEWGFQFPWLWGGCMYLPVPPFLASIKSDVNGAQASATPTACQAT